MFRHTAARNLVKTTEEGLLNYAGGEGSSGMG
jgi:hypothetical protein